MGRKVIETAEHGAIGGNGDQSLVRGIARRPTRGDANRVAALARTVAMKAQHFVSVMFGVPLAWYRNRAGESSRVSLEEVGVVREAVTIEAKVAIEHDELVVAETTSTAIEHALASDEVDDTTKKNLRAFAQEMSHDLSREEPEAAERYYRAANHQP
jgi:hypothetical protein